MQILKYSEYFRWHKYRKILHKKQYKKKNLKILGCLAFILPIRFHSQHSIWFPGTIWCHLKNEL